ncbi:MAG: hypothetical protein ACI8ZB_003418 [Desulforhopalus sp.]|jgi:hypothetical protein
MRSIGLAGMEAEFCVDCLEKTLHEYGKTKIFNSDQTNDVPGILDPIHLFGQV